MDITAFEADGSACDTLILDRLYQRLPSLPKVTRQPIHITVSIGGHVFKLAILIVALAGCILAYSLGIVWICLFWTQAKLLIITAALLRSCLEDEHTDSNLCNPVAIQEPLEDVQGRSASEEDTEHVPRSAQSDHDSKVELTIDVEREAEHAEHDEWGDSPEELATDAQREDENAEHDEWGDSPDDTQAELGDEWHGSTLPTEHWQNAQSIPTTSQQEVEPAVNGSQQQEDVFEENGRNSSLPMAQPEPMQEEQHGPLAVAHRPSTRRPAATPKLPVSKEEKKAQAQTAWLHSMGSGTGATGSGTPAMRDTGFTAAQIAEAASFMKEATRGGNKQPPKPRASIRGSKPSVAPALKPRHPNAGSPSTPRTAEVAVPQKPRRADPSATLAPHLRKAKEARERNRMNTEDSPKECMPMPPNRVKYETAKAKENEPRLESTASHEESRCTEPVSTTAVDHEVEEDQRLVLADTQGFASQKANESTSAIPQVDAAVGADRFAAVHTENLEAQAVDSTTFEGTENECATYECSPERVIYDLDTLKSLDTTRSLTPILGADVERAQRLITANNVCTDFRFPIAKKPVSGGMSRPQTRSLAAANNVRIKIVDQGTTSAPRESGVASGSAERTAAVELAVGVLNQQAHQKRQSLSVLHDAISSIASSAAAGVMQDPAVMFCTPERMRVNNDSSDTIDQQQTTSTTDEKARSETVSLVNVNQGVQDTVSSAPQKSPSVETCYAHADLLDLDFSPSPTSKPLAPAPHRRNSSLSPTAPPFFAPSPSAVPSRAITTGHAPEYAISEETEDTLEMRRQYSQAFVGQLPYQEMPSFPVSDGSFGPGYVYQQAVVTSPYLHHHSPGQLLPMQSSYAYEQAPPGYAYPQASQPQYYLDMPNGHNTAPRQRAEAPRENTGAVHDPVWNLVDLSRQEPPTAGFSEHEYQAEVKPNKETAAGIAYMQRMLSNPQTVKTSVPSRAISVVKPSPIPDALNYKSEQEFPSLPSSRKTTETLALPPGISAPQPSHQAAFDAIVADGASTVRSKASLSGPAEVDASEHHALDTEDLQSEHSNSTDPIAEASDNHDPPLDSSASNLWGLLSDTDPIAESGDNHDPPLDSSAGNLWRLLGDEEPSNSASRPAKDPSASDASHLMDDEAKPVNTKKVVKERKKAARDALLAAWYEREVARKKVTGNWTLEGMQALKAATVTYNTKRSELQQCMGDGKLNSSDAEYFPALSANDVKAPKHRPAGAEEAHREQRPAEEAATHIQVEEPIFSELNELRKKLFIAHGEYDKAIAFFERPPPQGRKDVRVLHAEGKARVERARNFYRKKRDALEKEFPQDPWLVDKFKPDPWHGFKVPDVVRAGR